MRLPLLLLIVATLLGIMAAIHTADRGSAQTAIPLFRGFNEVVWPVTTVSVPDGLASIAGQYSAVFRWDNAGQRWDTFAPQLPAALQGFDQFEEGRAYWIAMLSSATLTPADGPAPPDPGIAQPAPPPPFGDGTYLVGVDVAAGTWRAPGGEFCSWQRLAGFSGDFNEIIAIDVVDGPAIVIIAGTDVGFMASGCGVWTLN